MRIEQNSNHETHAGKYPLAAGSRFLIVLLCLMCGGAGALAQRVLTLDSCRSLALRNNKQLNISKLSRQMASQTRKAARTKYLPKVAATGTYQFTSREISILNNADKTALSNMGTSVGTQFGSSAQAIIGELTQNGVITPSQAQVFGDILGKAGTSMTDGLNKVGQHIRDAFDTDTRHVMAADILITQPIYTGGAITAANNIAKLSEELAANNIDSHRQQTIYDTDQAYWTVVSLRQKQKLAESYLALVSKLHANVEKMIAQGVATRAEGLRVAVKVNEAEMAKAKVDDGLSLARMLLCQLCGLDISKGISLADEDAEELPSPPAVVSADMQIAMDNRPELRMLQNAIDISKENTKLVRAAYLPKVVAMGGYMISNPCLFNGFERRFSGMFHAGVMVQVPVWSWFEGRYKMNATKAASSIAQMELEDTEEKIELQVNQNIFKTTEADKRLVMATKNTESAEENLRCANIGFKEGVMSTTDVMAAQTAWLEARSRKIDAEIDVRLSRTNLQKSLGTLCCELNY